MITKILRAIILLAIMALPLTSLGANKETIFINLATNDPDKVLMALDASRQYAEKGFPRVVFLNDNAVILGVVNKGGSSSRAQEALKIAVTNGAIVNICPMCLKQAGFTEADLISGVKLGSPKVTGDALFKDGTKTMSW